MPLTDQQAMLFLERNLGVVATMDAEGRPHLTPVWVDWDGECVVFNTSGKAKQRHLHDDSSVAVCVVSRDDPSRYVTVIGTAEILEDGAWEHADRLARKYRGPGASMRRSGRRRVIVRIHPRVVYGQVPNALARRPTSQRSSPPS